MLKDFIFYSSYGFILLFSLLLMRGRKRRAEDVLIGVALLTIGKLFYLPFLNLVSVKAGFIFTTIVGSISLLISFIKGVDKFLFVPFILVLPALLSIVFLYPISQSMFVAAASNATSAGSPLLRIISILFTSIYCAYVINYVSTRKNGQRDTALSYVVATLFATFIGGFMTYGLFTGDLTKDALVPVSVEEIHMAGRLFRFNPGASVNEFGEIAGYSVFMLRWTGWRTATKISVAAILMGAIFMSLTRGAWVGLVVGYMVYAMFSEPKQRTRIFLAAGMLIGVLLVVTLSNDLLRALLISRTSLGDSPGGNDRLNTAAAIFEAMTRTPLRSLFGYGWAADIFSPNYGFPDIGYIHSVPLMFLFDTGLVGVAICAMTFYALGRFILARVRKDLDIFAGIIAFMFTVSMFEHIFFHVQTWLMLGLLLGIALRSPKIAAQAPASPRLQEQAAQ